MKDNIVLIGFMGVGKGRSARSLASLTGMFAVDGDDLIESMANMKIKKIFEIYGEEYFRNLEQNMARWLEKSVNSTIISTGGGFYKVKNLKKIGRIVYLHSGFEAIISGLKEADNAARKIQKRPLLQDLNRARVLYDERVPLYRKVSEVEISVAGRTADQIASEIVARLAATKKKKSK